MAGTQRCGKWEKTVNREALCMRARAPYNVFGIQRSLFQIQQLSCLLALVVSGQALERFMKRWCILKQMNPPRRCSKMNWGLPHHPFMGGVLKVTTMARGLEQKPGLLSISVLLWITQKGSPWASAHWQSRVSHTPTGARVWLLQAHTHTHKEWSQAWTFLFTFQDGQARASSDLETLPKRQ